MTTAYTSLLGLALPVTGELSGTWGDTVNTAITSLLDTAVAGTTSITTDADITLTTTTGASNQARQAIILWNPASGTVTRNITAPAQSKMYTVINASGGTQSIVIRGVGPTTGVTILKGESALVAWNGSDFVKVSTVGGSGTFIDLTVTGNTILGDAITDTLTVNATTSFTAPVKLPSTGRSAAAALTVTNPAFLYGVASTYTDTTSSGTIAAMAPFYSLAQPTLSTSNVTTYTSAATLYLANAPAAGGSATITNPYALYVNSGTSYFGGNMGIATTPLAWASSNALSIGATASFAADSTTAYVGQNVYYNAGWKIATTGSVAGSLLSVGQYGRLSFSGASSGTAGAASTLTTYLFIDGFNGGAATFGPTSGAALDASVAISNTNFYSNLSFQHNGTTFANLLGWYGQGLYTYSDVLVWLNTAGSTEYMRLTSTGLGIGTSSPGSVLDLQKATAEMRLTSTTGTNAVWTRYSNTGGFFYIGAENSTGSTFGTGAAYAGVVYVNGANPLIFATSGTERMRLDASGNLGIGASSPSNLLTLNKTSGAYGINLDGGAYGTLARFGIVNVGTDNNSYIGSVSNNNFLIRTAGVTAATFDTAGNLGLGVTPSAWQTGANLKAFQVGVGAAFFSDTNSAYLGQNVYQNSVGTSLYINTNYASKYQQTSSVHSWHIAPSGTAGTAITFTQAMTLDASGNLLVGTTSSGGPLTVLDNAGTGTYSQAGTFRKSSTNTTNYYQGARVVVQNTSATTGNFASFGFQTANSNDYAAVWGICSSHTTGFGAGSLAFGTSNNDGVAVERARIDASGNLLVGTTTTATSTVGISFLVGSFPYMQVVGGGTASHYAAAFYNGNGLVGRIETSGSATAYVTSSDYRLKENIAPMTGALAKIAALKPVTYTWKVDGSGGEGFIAHELAEVCPHAVSGDKDAVDADGNPQYQGIDTSFLVATLTAAIQEQQALIESLTTRLAALEAK